MWPPLARRLSLGLTAIGNTLTYDAGFADDVYLNGVRLDRYRLHRIELAQASCLASGAALNDELYVVAFGTFNVASFNGSGLD
jgi:hypothetical protein